MTLPKQVNTWVALSASLHSIIVQASYYPGRNRFTLLGAESIIHLQQLTHLEISEVFGETGVYYGSQKQLSTPEKTSIGRNLMRSLECCPKLRSISVGTRKE